MLHLDPSILAVELGAWTAALLASVGYIAKAVRKGTETTTRHIQQLKEDMIRGQVAAAYTDRDLTETRATQALQVARQTATEATLAEHLRWHRGAGPGSRSGPDA